MQPTPSDPYQQYTYGYAPAAPDRLLAHSKFVVDQKAKLIELRNEYSIYDESGNRIGSVMQVGQSFLTRLLRLVLKGDSLLGVKLEIREANGAVALLLHKPAFRITCAVSRPNGTVIGRIAAKIRLGKARMAITDPAERRDRPAHRPGRQEVGRRPRAVHDRGQVPGGAGSQPP